MGQKIVQVDAFASKPFTGNPAAVCVMEDAANEVWMQNVAMEMNLSETAFLYPRDKGYHLRWFTPTMEIPLCGHATLASAHVLYTEGHVPADKPITFESMSGPLSASFDGEWITLDFPANPPKLVGTPSAEEVLSAFGYPFNAVFGIEGVCLVEIEDESMVREYKPDIAKIRELADIGAIITARSYGGEFDFVSRFFAPGAGVDEDPVTGAAHTVLAPYWAERLGKTEFTAYQASARGGVLLLRLEGNRVKIGGQAVTVMRGELV